MSLLNYYGHVLRKMEPKIKGRSIIALAAEDNIYHYFARKANVKQKRESQDGGAKSIKYEFDNKTFIWDIEKDENVVNYIVYTVDNDKKKQPLTCVMLSIDLDEKNKYVYMTAISNYENCALEGMPKTGAGSLILRMSLAFIKQYLNPKYDLKHVQLKDNSHFLCHINKQMINFDSLYMLAYGNTWYGKYGFIPFDPDNKILDEKNYEIYKKNQQIVNTTLVKTTNLKNILLNANKKLNFTTIKKTEKIIEKFKNETIRKFMYIMMKKYDKTCHILSEIYEKIMVNIGMFSLHGRSYYLQL